MCEWSTVQRTLFSSCRVGHESARVARWDNVESLYSPPSRVQCVQSEKHHVLAMSSRGTTCAEVNRAQSQHAFLPRRSRGLAL